MHAEAITRVWAGGEDSFLLNIDSFRAIERQCGGSGIEKIYSRIAAQQAGIDDILAPVRLGLIGGGMTEREALDAMDRALSMKRPYALRELAFELLLTFWIGMEADDPGEFSAGEATSQTRSNHSPTEQPDGADTSQQEP